MQAKNEINVTFKSRLADLVRERGYRTKAALARAIGVTHVSAANYLNGRVPEPETLVEISYHFGVSVDWLLKEDALRERPDSAKPSPSRRPIANRAQLGKPPAVPAVPEPATDLGWMRRLDDKTLEQLVRGLADTLPGENGDERLSVLSKLRVAVIELMARLAPGGNLGPKP
jgi:transcriptional regulator with XRE-family HTH domain